MAILLNGGLPNAETESRIWMPKVLNHTMVHDQVNRFFNGFRRDAHPWQSWLV